MSTLGFDKYVEPLKLYLAKYREAAKNEKPVSTKKSIQRREMESAKSNMSTNSRTPHSLMQMSGQMKATPSLMQQQQQQSASTSRLISLTTIGKHYMYVVLIVVYLNILYIGTPQVGMPTTSSSHSIQNAILPGVNSIGNKIHDTIHHTTSTTIFPESPYLSSDGNPDGMLLPPLSTIGVKRAAENELSHPVLKKEKE
jgi:hypothetical protein